MFTVLLVLCLGAPGWAQDWMCKKDLAYLPQEPPPTDVVTDAAGRIYILYGQDGFLDVYDPNGKLLEHRGGQAGAKHAPRSITGVSQWVGRLATSALLAAEPGNKPASLVLVPDGKTFKTIRLRKCPEAINGVAALARDLDGRIYVWASQCQAIYYFDNKGHFAGQVETGPLKRPVQLAVDSEGSLYCLDSAGVHVFSKAGAMKYEVAGAQAMYLTGADRLALAGSDWIRRYSPEGQIEVEVREQPWMENRLPVAVSLNDKSQFFAYYRDGDSGTGVIVKLDSRGNLLHEFPQSSRIPPAPDPGYRLDYEGRLHVWEADSSTLLKVHPGGKVERSISYTPGSDPDGRLLNPADMVVDGNGVVWIADAGNSRLQRFQYGKGWLGPISVGIRGGAPRAIPRNLALTPGGTLLCVVHAPDPGQGQVVLQTRDLKGLLLAQRDLGSDYGNPVVKVSTHPNGDIYIYRSRCNLRGFETFPILQRFDARGNLAASAGGDGGPLNPPGQPQERLVMSPQEDLVPFGDGILMVMSGRLLQVTPDLKVVREFHVTHPRKSVGARVLSDFGGATLAKGVLYLADIANRCVHRIPIPR